MNANPPRPSPEQRPIAVGPRLLLVPTDPTRAAGVFALDHPYVEDCWLPVLGPSSTLLLRRTGRLWMAASPAEVHAAELSASLGLGYGTGATSRFAATVHRLCRFGFASWQAPDSLGVAHSVPLLSPHALARQTPWTQQRHHDHVAGLSRLLARPGAGHAPERSVRPDVGRDVADDASLMAARLRGLGRGADTPTLSR